MNAPSLSLAETVRQLVRAEAGGEIRTSAEAAAAATRLHEKLARHLSPAIGEAGLEALVSRSIKMTRPTLPGLLELETTGPAESVLRRYFEHLAKEEPAAVEAITASVIVTAVGMLSALLGKALSWQLLRNAWPDLPSEPPAEKTAP